MTLTCIPAAILRIDCRYEGKRTRSAEKSVMTLTAAKKCRLMSRSRKGQRITFPPSFVRMQAGIQGSAPKWGCQNVYYCRPGYDNFGLVS
jgi:hypothetical protein